jgi:D-alanyl-D-alanine carboxypeptidase (penicillin-binding protein 5/6)
VINAFLKKSYIVVLMMGSVAMAEAAEIVTPAQQAYITDFESGEVLFSKGAEVQMKPASMAKIMTVFITFHRIAEGSLSLNDTFMVSEKAWRKGGSRSFLEVESNVSVSDLLHGVIVQSGNDAAIVIAEGISGTEEAFAKEMNFWAQKLGMTNTNFRNATGWPDPELTTTAKDMSLLTSELISQFPVETYPELYPIFLKKEFTYNQIKQSNRNPLIYGTDGADGLKTGHTEESGYGLVGSATRNGQRVIMVLNGMDSIKQRSIESRRLINLMFREFKHYTFFEKGQVVDQANVWLGNRAKVDLVLAGPLKLLLSQKNRQALEVSVQRLDPIPAPIKVGDQIGTLVFSLPGGAKKYPLLAAQNVQELGLFNRIGAAVRYLVFGASTPPVIAQ